MNFSRPVLLMVMAGLLCIGVSAQSNTKSTHKQTDKKDVGTAKVAGMQVAIDPKTGRLRQPTPEERAKLAKALGMSLNRSEDGLKVVRYANGMERVDLNGRFQSLSVAKVGANGKVQERCVTNPKEAQAFLNETPKSKKSAESKAEAK
jgi:hypothetical protein